MAGVEAESNKRHFLGLDLVRFWAACAVASYHLAFWSWASPSDLPSRAAAGRVHYEVLEPFTWFGWCGVETFFVLSGFVICVSAHHSTPYAFLRGRIGRLLPAISICASLTALVLVALALAPGAQVLDAYWRSLVIFPVGPWVDSVYRTLIVEEIFYALVLVLLLLRMFRHAEAVAFGLGLASIGFWLLGAVVDVRGMAPAAILNFAKYGIFFALGMMVWVASARGWTRARVVVLTVLASFCAAEVWLVALGMRPFAPNAAPLTAVVVWLGSFVAILLSVCFKDAVHAGLGRWTGLLRLAGLMTYPLYLVHDVVGSAVLRLASSIGQAAALICAGSVSLAIAFVVVRCEPLIRRPMIACLDRLVGLARRASDRVDDEAVREQDSTPELASQVA